MRHSSTPLTERLAEIGGELQKLRWEAQDAGQERLARDIAHAIDAIAWAAGIYNSDANIIERSGSPPAAAAGQRPEAQPAPPRVAAKS